MSSAKMNLFWLIVFGATLPLGVVLSTHLARKSFEKVKLRDQVITVKGYAEKRIESDLAMWNATISVRNPSMTEAYAKLEKDRARLISLVVERGFKAAEVSQSPASIGHERKRDEKGNYTNTIEGYVVTQSFELSSNDVKKLASVAIASADLIKEGVELSSGQPQYLCTKLNDAKLDLLADATKNARARAEQLMANSGGSLGGVKSASQGVFQITPVYSTEVSGGGTNDTSTIDKLVKAVVTVEYAIQ